MGGVISADTQLNSPACPVAKMNHRQMAAKASDLNPMTLKDCRAQPAKYALFNSP